MKKNKIILVIAFTITAIGVVFSQQEKKFIYDGNKYYKDGKFEKAQQSYNLALEKNMSSKESIFNLGDALFRQEKYTDAAQQFSKIATSTDNKNIKAQAYHNLGNSLLLQTKEAAEKGDQEAISNKIDESIEAYKNALRINQNDEATRYNLAYAQNLKKQQQNNQSKNQDKNDKQDNKDNQENKEQDKNKEEQKNENKNKENNQEEQNEQQAQQQKGEMNKKDAERLLEALNNDEKKVQEKVKLQKLKGVKVEIDKDW
jgi:Ca-activated chloride channel homolog